MLHRVDIAEARHRFAAEAVEVSSGLGPFLEPWALAPLRRPRSPSVTWLPQPKPMTPRGNR